MDWRDLFACMFTPTDIIEIRVLPPAESAWFKASDTDAIGRYIAAHPKQNIYFGANPRTAVGLRSTEGVAIARCLFVDLDGCTVQAAGVWLRESGLPAPTAVVFSGGGVHFYWLLDEPMSDLAAWTGRQRGLIDLFRRCNAPADKVIHDPPRIMRVPGTVNHKRGNTAMLAECVAGRVYSLDEFPAPIEGVAVPTAPLASAPGGGASPWTERFIREGAAEGERNARLFQAACDLNGRGVSWAEAERMLMPAASRSGLIDREARTTIRSAYQKPRAPNVGGVVMDENTPIGGGMAGGASIGSPGPILPDTAAKRPDTPSDTTTIATGPDNPRVRGTLANTATGWIDGKGKDGETKKVRAHFYRPIEAIAHDLREMTDHWPRLLNGKMFVVGETNEARFITGTDDLFAWIHSHAAVRWGSGKSQVLDRDTLLPLTAVTKPEFAAYLDSTSEHRYESATSYPHHPPMRRTFYFPFTLPASDGSALRGFLDLLNPETEADRTLMAAALFTLFWGGEPGTRPVFVFRSSFGMGSGKTATAHAIASVAGGHYTMDPDQPWPEACKGLMSSSDANTRCLLFDNIRSRFGTATVEAAITARHLCGHRMYVGTIMRPNDLCVFLTFNTPELSPDFAQRAVVINIGPQRHGVDFVAAAAAYVREHRWAIIADVIAALAGPDAEDTSAWVMDRWSGWARGVLAKCPGGGDAMRLIALRRPEVDAEAEEAEGWSDIIGPLVAAGTPVGRGVNGGGVEVTAVQIRAAAMHAGLWSDDKGRSLQQNVIKCAGLAAAKLAKLGKLRKTTPPRRKQVTIDGGAVVRSLIYMIPPEVADDDVESRIPL